MQHFIQFLMKTWRFVKSSVTISLWQSSVAQSAVGGVMSIHCVRRCYRMFVCLSVVCADECVCLCIYYLPCREMLHECICQCVRLKCFLLSFPKCKWVCLVNVYVCWHVCKRFYCCNFFWRDHLIWKVAMCNFLNNNLWWIYEHAILIAKHANMSFWSLVHCL